MSAKKLGQRNSRARGRTRRELQGLEAARRKVGAAQLRRERRARLSTGRI